jgi:hypothetical protein
VRECAFFAAMLPGPKALNPYKKMDKVLARSTRIVKRMYAARMISAAQYAAALAETPNLAGLARKIEQTMAAPPPGEALPPGFSPDNGIMVPEGAPAREAPAVDGGPGPDRGDGGHGPVATDNDVI